MYDALRRPDGLDKYSIHNSESIRSLGPGLEASPVCGPFDACEAGVVLGTFDFASLLDSDLINVPAFVVPQARECALCPTAGWASFWMCLHLPILRLMHSIFIVHSLCPVLIPKGAAHTPSGPYLCT